MKSNYSSPTIFNASNMKLSTTSHGNNSLVIENPAEDGILLALTSLAKPLPWMNGPMGIGQKAFGLPNRKF